jgi:hypothetical protein
MGLLMGTWNVLFRYSQTTGANAPKTDFTTCREDSIIRQSKRAKTGKRIMNDSLSSLDRQAINWVKECALVGPLASWQGLVAAIAMLTSFTSVVRNCIAAGVNPEPWGKEQRDQSALLVLQLWNWHFQTAKKPLAFEAWAMQFQSGRAGYTGRTDDKTIDKVGKRLVALALFGKIGAISPETYGRWLAPMLGTVNIFNATFDYIQAFNAQKAYKDAAPGFIARTPNLVQ